MAIIFPTTLIWNIIIDFLAHIYQFRVLDRKYDIGFEFCSDCGRMVILNTINEQIARKQSILPLFVG